MKIELKKEEKIDGDIFYYIYADDKFVKSFFESPEDRQRNNFSGLSEAKRKAIDFFKEMKDRKPETFPIVTILDTHETPTHEPETQS